MKTLIDQLTKTDVTINLISTGNGASITMCANGILITETVRGDAYSAAKVAFAKRDLSAFGALFDGAAERMAA